MEILFSKNHMFMVNVDNLEVLKIEKNGIFENIRASWRVNDNELLLIFHDKSMIFKKISDVEN